MSYAVVANLVIASIRGSLGLIAGPKMPQGEAKEFIGTTMCLLTPSWFMPNVCTPTVRLLSNVLYIGEWLALSWIAYTIWSQKFSTQKEQQTFAISFALAFPVSGYIVTWFVTMIVFVLDVIIYGFV